MISILSDFGLEDSYVAAMKAVIHAIAPQQITLDLTHQIPPGDVARGAIELWRVAPLLPDDSVILGVVDPGVGTDRKAVAVRTRRFTCVGPDNGLFSYLMVHGGVESVVELSNPVYHRTQVSSTFHGRDIFAPAAAHLAKGVPLTELGPPVPEARRLPSPELQFDSADVVRGEILYADRFGNLITSIGMLSTEGSSLRLEPWTGSGEAVDLPAGGASIALPDGTEVAITSAFGDVPAGSLTAYIGSAGLLEIAINGGNAHELTGLKRGDSVEFLTQG